MPICESAEAAIARIKQGMRVLVPPACGLPQVLVEELGRQAQRFTKLEVVGGYLIDSAPYVDERFEAHFHYRTFHPGGEAAKALARGQASYVPMRYFDALRLFAPKGPLAADVLLLQVAPPDARGRYSLGVSPSYPLPLAKTAPLVIAQVNPQMPRTLGDSFLDANDIDVIVDHDEPLRAYRTAPVGEVERRIAGFVADLIEDGSTLQAGLGAIPEALTSLLTHKRDLRLTSLLVSSARALFESGALSPVPEHHSICEIMGDRAMFEFVHEHPLVHMRHSVHVHDPRVIAELPKFVSVISAVEVDLSGQANAEALGTRAVAGIGGQLDFAMGAAIAPDGLCILALPSRAGKHHEMSRIVARLSEGAPVTTPRSLVSMVVTEHGVADLRGKNLQERRKALIELAAPEHRVALERD